VLTCFSSLVPSNPANDKLKVRWRFGCAIAP
jgi:hypothetical protein